MSLYLSMTRMKSCRLSPLVTEVDPISLKLMTVPPIFCIAAVKEQLVRVDG